MRSRGFVLPGGLAVALVALACGKPEPGGKAASPGGPAATTPAGLGSVSGKYVRGPQHDRVIIFVNGVFGDQTSTWTNASTGKYWPDLLVSDPGFADADVYVHSFLSPHLTTAQQILELAGRMKDRLQTDQVIARHMELVFLCHSMGGLVTRAFLLSARLPAAKVPMIYFFATPTAGANIAGIAAHISGNPQLADMKPLEDGGYVKDLREQWLLTSNEPTLDYPNKVASYCAYELKDTWGFRIVEELSATYLCNHETRAVVENHLDIVKPADQTADAYVFFKAAYERRFSPEAAPIHAELMLRSTAPLAANRRELRLGTFKARDVILKQVKATSQAIEVECGGQKSGLLEAGVDLAPGETISQVNASVGNASNLGASGAAVVRQSNGKATVSYTIRGPDKTGPGCPGGRADVVVNFVINRAATPGVPHPAKTLQPIHPTKDLHVKAAATPSK